MKCSSTEGNCESKDGRKKIRKKKNTYTQNQEGTAEIPWMGNQVGRFRKLIPNKVYLGKIEGCSELHNRRLCVSSQDNGGQNLSKERKGTKVDSEGMF